MSELRSSPKKCINILLSQIIRGFIIHFIYPYAMRKRFTVKVDEDDEVDDADEVDDIDVVDVEGMISTTDEAHAVEISEPSFLPHV